MDSVNATQPLTPGLKKITTTALKVRTRVTGRKTWMDFVGADKPSGESTKVEDLFTATSRNFGEKVLPQVSV